MTSQKSSESGPLSTAGSGLERLGGSHAGMGMIRQEGERLILREHQIAASEEGLDLDQSAGGSGGICW